MLFKDRQQHAYESWELRTFQLEAGLFHINDQILPIIFRNLVLVAIRLEKISWVKKFIGQHKGRVLKDENDSIYNHVSSFLTFYRKDYQLTLDLLNRCHHNHSFYKMEEKRLRLKVYYELNEVDLFWNLINSFRKFLTDYKRILPERDTKAHRSFLHYIILVDDLRSREKEKASKLFQELEKEHFATLPDKSWLIEKIQEKR